MCGGGRTLKPPHPPPQFAFLETIVTAVTDEFPYYLRPKKVMFSGLICVAMYLMGLVLTTEVSGFGGRWLVGEAGRTPLAVSVDGLCTPGTTHFLDLFGRHLDHLRPSPWPVTQSLGFGVWKTWFKPRSCTCWVHSGQVASPL